jgi:hypothetical protein
MNHAARPDDAAVVNVLIVLGALAAALLLCLLAHWMGTRCHICLTRRARWEFGDTPICEHCWEEAQRVARLVDAVSSRVADETIKEYYRRRGKQP